MICLGAPALDIACLDMADAYISYVNILYLMLALYFGHALFQDLICKRSSSTYGMQFMCTALSVNLPRVPCYGTLILSWLHPFLHVAYRSVSHLDTAQRLQDHLYEHHPNMINLGTPSLDIAYLDVVDANRSYVNKMYLNLILFWSSHMPYLN